MADVKLTRTPASGTRTTAPQAHDGPGRHDVVSQGRSPDGAVALQHQLRHAAAARSTATWSGPMAADKWAWIEKVHDSHPELVQRPFLPSQHQKDPDVKRAFGTETPPSSDALLHYAGDPPPGVPVQPNPVLLVHGATKDATSLREAAEGFRQAGYRTYAVTFAHNQDDGFFWAQQIGNCVDHIFDKTGGKVLLFPHSKGGQAAQIYVSDYRDGAEWMSPYRHHVQGVCFTAAPLGGIDYSFRHPMTSVGFTAVSDGSINAPIAFDKQWSWGLWKTVGHLGFGNPEDKQPKYFAGQSQMLARLDARHPLAKAEPDWYTTYFGGLGMLGHSCGIEHYIVQGGNMVANLQEKGILPEVKVAMLAGNKADLPFPFSNETTGESDGLLFTDRALAAPRGAHVVGRQVLPLNHMDIVTTPQGIAAMVSMAHKLANGDTHEP